MSIGVSGTNKVKTEPLGKAGEVRITEKMNELPEARVRDMENNGRIVPITHRQAPVVVFCPHVIHRAYQPPPSRMDSGQAEKLLEEM